MAASASGVLATEFCASDSSAQKSSPRCIDDEGGAEVSSRNYSFRSDVSPDKKSHAMEAVKRLDMRSQKHSLEQLKDTAPSTWNDKARHVYKGFNVTRYIVENNFILNPQLDQNFLLLNEVLCGTDRGREWLSIKKKLEEVLELFYVPGVEKMTYGLFDEETFDQVCLSLHDQMEFGTYSKDKSVKEVQDAMKHTLIKFRKEVEDCYETERAEEQDELIKGKRKRKHVLQLNEKFFKRYLEMLVATLARFTCWATRPILTKSYDELQFTTSSFGTSLVSPEPDFAIMNTRHEASAFVEVKSHYRQMFPLYRRHRMPGKRKRDAGQEEVMETAQTSFPTEDSGAEEEYDMDEYTDEHIDDAFDEDDKFDENETKVETAKAEKLEEHMRRLEVKEKKQIRCFLPQLLAELMGACNQTTHQFLNTTYKTKRFGIAVVGVKARFVTMVIQDKSKNLSRPGPSDIENKNVSTKVYMTREMNLFKKSHLMMFFEILYAMGRMGTTRLVISQKGR